MLLVSHHESNSVARQTVGQELGELAVPVWDVDALVCLLLGAQLGDAVAEDHQTLVDVVRLLQRLAFTLGLLGHLTASKVHEIDLAMSGDVDTLATGNKINESLEEEELSLWSF